ncbi:MAG TPA: hypothetical protein VHR45_05995 [Thermoanaerobaculia bacterium]|nr:hypothetical protein [Thermoanaerobaculia bacterium]
MRYRPLVVPLVSAALLVAALGCGKANPVAPAGSTVTLSASPSQIGSSTGSSLITAVVRKGNGQPAAGVEVRFTTTLGTIDVLAKTDNGGVALATLKGDGRFGTAMVGAVVDGGATATQISILIGLSAKSLTLQANPPTVSQLTGGTVVLTALVRDQNGRPLGGILVNFSTTLGTLASGGIAITNTTDPKVPVGEATIALSISAADAASQATATVTAQAAAGDGSLLSATATILILTGAETVVLTVDKTTVSSSSGGTVNLTATVTNAGQPVGNAQVFFNANGGGTLNSGGAPQSTGANGKAMDVLTVPKNVSAGTQIILTARVGSTTSPQVVVTVTSP